KIIKDGILKNSFKNAKEKSCSHKFEESVGFQVRRLKKAGYGDASLLGAFRRAMTDSKRVVEFNGDKRNISVIPYRHNVSHKIKKHAMREGVKVIFSFPEKMLDITWTARGSSRDRKRCHKDNE